MISINSKSKHAEEFKKEGSYHEPEYITIHVINPITNYDDPAKPFTTYEIKTETNFPQYKGREFNVRRRYTDFVSLQKVMYERQAKQDPNAKHGAIPPLPGDSLSSLFRVGNGRFDPLFIEERRKGLEQFLNNAANHTLLRFEPELHKFLTDPKHVIQAPVGSSWW